MTNHYLRLGLSDYSNLDAIKNQYRKLAKIYHPDKNPDNPKAQHKFQVVAHSYQFLNDPLKKAALDQYLQSRQHRLSNKANHAERAAEAQRTKVALKRQEIEHRYFKYTQSGFSPKRRMIIALFFLTGLCSFFVMNYFQNYEDRSMVIVLAFCALTFAAFIYLLVDGFYVNHAYHSLKNNHSVDKSIRKSGYIFILLFFATPLFGSVLANVRRSALLKYKTHLAKPISIEEDKQDQEWMVTFYANHELYTCKINCQGMSAEDKKGIRVAYYPGDPRLCKLTKY